jgi:RNA polymerase sigma-70 factor (ECF subfamily)
VFVWLRRSGYGEADAEDLVQGFVAHLLEKNCFSRVSAGKGKFRSFLLKSLQHFLSDEQDRVSAIKRGRGSTIVPLEQVVEEGLVRQAATGVTPDAAFDHRWALRVLEQAFAALEREFLHRGKSDQFRELSAYLESEGGASEYALTATKLQMTPGAVAVAVHRLRAEYRDCIRHQIAETVNSPADAREEMNYLLEVLSHIATSE